MTFSLSFHDGPLGLTITPKGPRIVVKAVKANCAWCDVLRAGDELVSVGARSVRAIAAAGATFDSVRFERLVAALRDAPRPVALTLAVRFADLAVLRVSL